MRLLPATLVIGLGLGIAVPPAMAQVIDKAQLGVSSRNATLGTSPATYVYFPSPADYSRAPCCLDGDSGAWQGPESKPGKPSQLGWEADFDHKTVTAEAQARNHLIHGFADLEVTTVQVPHNVGGRLVGTIPAFCVVTQKQAQTEGALSFTFGRDIWMAGRFSALQPQNDNESVGGQGGAAWNADRMREAIRNVHVDGSLPPAKVSAAARGKVVDVYGHPVMGATVVLQHKSGRAFRKLATGRTDALGRFALRAKARGVFRVVAALAGSSATGKTFRQ